MMESKELNIRTVKIKDLKPYEKNPRKNDEAVKYVRASIEEFGWRVPIVVDRNMVIIAGHTRYKAAKQMGLKEAPCVIADDLTEEQAAAFRLIDNKTQELSSWDFGKLIGELDELVDEFAMSVFGFNTDEGNRYKSGAKGVEAQDLDDGGELDLDDFADDQFSCECPSCGFRFND